MPYSLGGGITMKSRVLNLLMFSDGRRDIGSILSRPKTEHVIGFSEVESAQGTKWSMTSRVGTLCVSTCITFRDGEMRRWLIKRNKNKE